LPVATLAPRAEATSSSTHLAPLEAEAIYIMRETAAQFERPVLLFSGGKDSAVLLRLAEKAFRPARFPFPVMHIDTGHNFAEALDFRDRRMDELGEQLIVRYVQDSIDQGRAFEEPGKASSRNRLQTVTLLDALRELGFDAAIGGARRDEEKARAKERIFSFRDEFGQWTPRTSGRSCGTCTTALFTKASTFVCFRCRIGPSWTFGPTSSRSGWSCRPSTTPIGAPCSSVPGC